MIELFANTKKGKYYYIGGGKCELCDKELDKIMIYSLKYRHGGGNFTVHRFCMDCLPTVKAQMQRKEIEEYYTAVVTERPPEASFPIFNSPKPLQDYKGGMSTFEAASNKNAPCETVIDRCIIANKTNRNIEINHKTREEKLKLLDNKDPDDILKAIHFIKKENEVKK